MKLEWMNHTGFVVSDMERSLAFYRDLLGLKEERNRIVEGEFISKLTGYPGAKIHLVFLGLGDMRHSVELLQYLDPVGERGSPTRLKDVGAAHLGIIVDDLEAVHEELSAKGVEFVNPPAVRLDGPPYPWARKACYLRDPDGNWLEFVERAPAPPGATVS